MENRLLRIENITALEKDHKGHGQQYRRGRGASMRCSRTERVRLSGIEHVDWEIAELGELGIAKETLLAGLLNEWALRSAEVDAVDFRLSGENSDVLSDRLLFDHGGHAFGNIVSYDVERQLFTQNALIN